MLFFQYKHHFPRRLKSTAPSVADEGENRNHHLFTSTYPEAPYAFRHLTCMFFCFAFPSVDKAGWGKKKVVYNSISQTYLLLRDWCIYFCSSYIFLLMLYTVLPNWTALWSVLQVPGIFSATSFFMALQYATACIYDNVFIHSCVVGHLCWVLFFFCYFQIVLQSYLQETKSSYTLTIFPKERNT